MDIRGVDGQGLPRYVASLEAAAGRAPSSEALQDASELYDLDRTVAIYEDGDVVGGTATDHHELTVPGGLTLPAGRTMLTAVLPTHRRRGLMRQLISWQMKDALAHGEKVLVGTTPVPEIVGRFDYWAAAQALAIEVVTGRSMRAGLTPPLGRVRMLETESFGKVLPEVFDRHLATQSGQVTRRPEFWRMWLRDRPIYRTAPGARFAVTFEAANGTTEGYLTYRLHHGLLREQPVETLVIEDLITVTDEARQALWTYCLEFDQATKVVATNLPRDEPLGWLVADRSKVRTTGIKDFLVLRLLDVPGALSGRRYAAPGTLVFDVVDPMLPANTGRFRLTCDQVHAECGLTTAEADLSLRVAALGAAYLGGFSFRGMARAGLVREHRSGALAQADAMFADESVPWTVTDW